MSLEKAWAMAEQLAGTRYEIVGVSTRGDFYELQFYDRQRDEYTVATVRFANADRRESGGD